MSLLADRGKYRSVPDKSFSLEKLAQDSVKKSSIDVFYAEVTRTVEVTSDH